LAQVIEMNRTQAPVARRLRPFAHSGRIIAYVDLSQPGVTEELSELAADWLYKQCSDDGKRKLLEQRNLLAA
jgi:hypothetical protein